MKKILLCLFALLLLCGCAKTSAPLAAEAVLPDSAKIMSVKPSYDTKYYARTMPRVMESDALQAFCEAYTKVLSAAQETAKDLPRAMNTNLPSSSPMTASTEKPSALWTQARQSTWN